MTAELNKATRFTIDRLTGSGNLADYAAFEGQVTGREPFVRSTTIDARCSPLALLPGGAAIQRCVTTDSSVRVVARLPHATIVVAAGTRSTVVEVSAETFDGAEEIVDGIRERAPKTPDETIPVRVWHDRPGFPPSSADRDLKVPLWNEIASNYSIPARAALGQLVELRPPLGRGRLILWHGAPGTGKTTAIRALMRAWSTWCHPQYISDPEALFQKPQYLSTVITEPTSVRSAPKLDRVEHGEEWRLIIAEDSDEYLRASARRDAGAALGRLLNLADGILGQGMKVLILLTTNEEIGRLHPALVRPGRCLASIEFPPLQPAEASLWLGAPVTHPMTLAELLERRGDFERIGVTDLLQAQPGQYL